MIHAMPRAPRSAVAAGRAAREEMSMSVRIQPGDLLRQVLRADALISGLVVVALIGLAERLGLLTGIPAGVLQGVGVALIPWVALLLWVGTRSAVPAAAVWLVIGLNAAGALGLAAVALGGAFDGALGLTPAGVGFAGVNALGALLLAELEFVGLRRSSPAAA